MEEKFVITKQTQIAKDFGLNWFPNGAGKQIVYNVFVDNKLVKTYISTEYKKTIYLHIIKSLLTTGGYEYECRFSLNPKKKFWKEAYKIINISDIAENQ